MTSPIPVHPQPSHYETVVTEEPGDLWVTYHDVEAIAARPPWSQAEAEQRLFGDKIKPGQGKHL